MKHLLLAASITAIGMTPAFAQSASEGSQLAELSFEAVDRSENGFIDMGESHNFGGDVFVSMDADENDRLSEGEFLDWGYGFENLAEDHDKELAYRTALRVVFSFWDRDGDGEISRAEHRISVNRDFQRADLDGDALLSQAEFLGGFSVMVAIRVALKPDNN